ARVARPAVTGGTLQPAENGGAGGVSVVNSTAAATAILDITNNHLIDHTIPIGNTIGGGAYDGLTGLIQTGRGGGGGVAPFWDGATGIITSQSSATGGSFTYIGIATEQQVKNLANPGDTAVWAGQTVTGTDSLIMYTYGGDANLDGKINVDDYGKIDFNVGLGVA